MAKKDIELKFGADLAPFNKATNRSQQRIKALEKQSGKLTGKLGRMQRATSKTGREFKTTDGAAAGLLTRMSSMIGPAALLTAGIGTVATALRTMAAEAANAKEKLLGEVDATKKLQQVAPQVAKDLGISDEAAFKILKKKADDIAATGSIPGGFSGAAETIFKSVSGGTFGAIDEIVKSAKFTDPAAISDALGKLRDPAGFGPGIGSPSGVISKFSFAAPISDFLIEEQTRQATELSSFAKEAGIGFDELLAALTGSSRGFPTSQRQTTGFRAILSTIRKVEAERGEAFAGTTISEKLRAFREADPKRFAEAKNREEFVLGLGPIEGAVERSKALLPQIVSQGETLAAFEKQLKLAGIPEISLPRRTRGATELRAQTEADVLGPRALRRGKAIDLFAAASLEKQQAAQESGETGNLEAFTRAIGLLGLKIDSFLEDTGVRGLLGFDTGGQSVAQLALEGARVRTVSSELQAKILTALQAIETNTRNAGNGTGLVTDAARANAHREGDR